MMDKWKPLCEKYNCTIANLALGWILAQGDFLNLLSGSTTVDQIKENVKSAELELDPEDVAYMRELAEEIDCLPVYISESEYFKRRNHVFKE